MTTRAYQAKTFTRAEYKMLYQCSTSAIHNLETVLEDEAQAGHHVQEWLVARLEAWQALKEKLETKLTN